MEEGEAPAGSMPERERFFKSLKMWLYGQKCFSSPNGENHSNYLSSI